MVSAIYDVTRDIHRRSCPVISLLQCIETVEFVQNVVFVSQVVQPLTTPATFFSVEIDGTKRHGADASVAQARTLRRHASSKRSGSLQRPKVAQNSKTFQDLVPRLCLL